MVEGEQQGMEYRGQLPGLVTREAVTSPHLLWGREGVACRGTGWSGGRSVSGGTVEKREV